MKRKKCFKCHKTKSIGEYYPHKGMSDGHLNKCIECTKKDVNGRYRKKMNDTEFIESERERGRSKYIKRRGDHRGGCMAYKKNFPEKANCHSAAQHIKVDSGFHKHHWCYLPELARDVIILTVSDHQSLHAKMIYDQERMMYRSLDGELLDTKEKHIELLAKIKKERDE